MSTFIIRLKNEEFELNEKRAKLTNFIFSDAFKDVKKEQQYLLKVQLAAMGTYSECLNQRLVQINDKENIKEQ